MRDTSLDDFLGEDDGADGEEETTPEEAPDPSEDAVGTEASGGTGRDDQADETDHDGGPAETDRKPEAAGEPGADGEADGEAVEPAVSTYDWTPGGADCEGCGAVVERRWRDDDGLVCGDCKAW